MKFFGEKSFSSFMYRVVKIGYWFSILLSLGIFYLVFTKKVPHTINEITSGIFAVKMVGLEKDLHKTIIYGIVSIMLISVFYFFIKMFDNFRKNIIFDKRNIKFLKYLALFKVIGGILGDLILYFDYKLAHESIYIQGVEIKYNILDNKLIDALFLAATYYMIAIALEKAIEYKEENDLTV